MFAGLVCCCSRATPHSSFVSAGETSCSVWPLAARERNNSIPSVHPTSPQSTPQSQRVCRACMDERIGVSTYVLPRIFLLIVQYRSLSPSLSLLPPSVYPYILTGAPNRAPKYAIGNAWYALSLPSRSRPLLCLLLAVSYRTSSQLLRTSPIVPVPRADASLLLLLLVRSRLVLFRGEGRRI